MAKAKFVLPEWINKEDWKGFVSMRVKIKKPLTPRAANQALTALGIVKENGQDPNLALQFAEYQGNRGIFPVPPWYKTMMGLSPGPSNAPKPKKGDF